MADKVDKPKKKAKPKKDETGVLAALPSTRPDPIGSRRAAKAAPKPAAKRAAGTAKASAAASTPRATATRRKAAAPRTFEPTQAAESAAGAADSASLRSSPRPADAGARSLRSSPRPADAGARAAGAVARPETPPEPTGTYPRPRPVSEGAPGIGTAGYRDLRSRAPGRASGLELAGTAVKAAGEVAQLGLSIGGHLLKRVAGRLPRP